jgi:hypothetical protein
MIIIIFLHNNWHAMKKSGQIQVSFGIRNLSLRNIPPCRVWWAFIVVKDSLLWYSSQKPTTNNSVRLGRHTTILKGRHLSHLSSTEDTKMICLLAGIDHEWNPTHWPKDKQ